MELKNPHIIIIDDEEELCSALKANLVRSGFKITTFLNTQNAYNFLENESCDVILSDIKMPNEDGITFLGRVRQTWPKIPFILMTGFAELYLAIDAIKFGAFDFIQKPMHIEQLQKTLERAVHYSKHLQLEENYKNEIEKSLEDEKIKSIHLGRLSAIGEMAGGIAHEINNPLSIITTATAIIAKKLESPNPIDEISKIKDNVEKIQYQVDRMTKMVLGLRNFSRTDNNNMDDAVAVGKLFTSIKELTSEKLKMKSVQFSSKAKDPELSFRCNLIQIEQVLVNLINNAVDAIANNEERWIKLEANTTNEALEISVTDSGPGIPNEIAEKIMQPFFTTKEIGKGTGLGLSISKGIIERHNGKLFLDQNASNTRFVIQIPII